MSQWSDYSTSTNAYILFYEQRSAPEPVQNNLSVIAGHQHQHSLFYKKVQKENELFEKQLQVSQ